MSDQDLIRRRDALTIPMNPNPPLSAGYVEARDAIEAYKHALAALPAVTSDREAAEGDPQVDTSYTGQIATLRAEREIDARYITHLRDELAVAKAKREKLVGALCWYGEQARLARLVHGEGDVGRHELQMDGGKRARAILHELGETK
jgi:hypothetical protein